MRSPLNNSANVSVETEIPIREIQNSYSRVFNINVEKYFQELETIKIYKCNDSGYRFYYPLHISGDSDFYIHFQQYDWYYLPWKWEHEISSKVVKRDDKVLEVGCGQGAFLKEINRLSGASCIGLELNKSSYYNTAYVKIKNESIEDFSKNNEGKFDIVCSFQVLEHISLVNSFIQSQVNCLKKGGTLIISVPNNDSEIIRAGKSLLNLPPHHMGLWNESSLSSLENYFGIKLKSVHYEPLQPYHFDMYIRAKLKIIPGNILKGKMIHLLKMTGIDKIIYRYLRKRASSIKGHSILAFYEKC